MATNMAHPKTVGDVTQAMVLARLVEAGHEVLLPFGENVRYDLVIDHGDRFTRVQCKTGRLMQGAVVFNTCSVNLHHPAARRGDRPYRRGYRGEADVFGVYCPGTKSVYLVAVDDVGTREAACGLSRRRTIRPPGYDGRATTSCPRRVSSAGRAALL